MKKKIIYLHALRILIAWLLSATYVFGQSTIVDNPSGNNGSDIERSSIEYVLALGTGFNAGGKPTGTKQLGLGISKNVAHNALNFSLTFIAKDSYIKPVLDSITGEYPKIPISSAVAGIGLCITKFRSGLFQGIALGVVSGVGFTGPGEGPFPFFFGGKIQINGSYWKPVGNDDIGHFMFGPYFGIEYRDMINSGAPNSFAGVYNFGFRVIIL